MKSIIGILVTICLIPVNAISQENDVRDIIIDSVLSKTSNLLALNVADDRYERAKCIRIIDLTGDYIKWKAIIDGFDSNVGKAGYFNAIPYIIKKGPVPYNLNSGVYRDLVFLRQKRRKRIVMLQVSVCNYVPNFGTQKCLVFNFEFYVNKKLATLKTFKVISDEQ